ncbi:unnamed protein product [Cunninghamella echinulata]
MNTNNNNNNHTVASSNKHHPKNNNKTMEQDLFEFFDSLSQPSPVGEWFTSSPSHQPLPSSAHSSPEIATPLDIHLSPPVKVENIPTSRVQATSLIGATASAATNTNVGGMNGMNGGDLDMSEILNSPLFDSPSSTPAMTPAMPQVDMFSELHQDLPSALAAFVAAVSSVTNNNTSSSNTSTPIIPTLPLNVNMSNDNTSSSSSSSNNNNNNNRKRSHSSSNDDNTTMSADEAAIKRQKNTDAARRSRLKKVMKMESLEKRVNELERMNAQLLLRVAVLDSEKSHLQTKEATHEARIKTLENQLAEAHKALASRS